MATAASVDTVPAGGSRPAVAAPAASAVTLKTWVAVIGATLGAFMAVVNIQIVNASLADIQGGIGAGIDDGGWISTSYLIAEIVVIPLSGWLAQVFSIRIYLLTNAFLFLVFSAACALAQDLPQMIALRAVQGFTGGVLIPLAFTLIITLLPKAKQPSSQPARCCSRSPRRLRRRSGRPLAAISPRTGAGNTSSMSTSCRARS
jgi:DHA2 family multidrug resistance protein